MSFLDFRLKRYGAFGSSEMWSSWPHHHLECLAIVHVSIAARHTVEVHDAVEDASRLDPAFQDVRQQFRDVGAHWSGTASYCDVMVEGRLGGGHPGITRALLASMMVGSGTFSILTSPAACMRVARIVTCLQ
jgi:hypothetical protein